MDINKVFASVIVVIVSVVALILFIGKFNIVYNTNLPPELSELNRSVLSYSSNIESLSLRVSNVTQLPEGAGVDSQEQSILGQARSAFSAMTELLGLVPSLIGAGARALNIPEFYISFGKYAFITLFSLAIAYLLFLGVKRFV